MVSLIEQKEKAIADILNVAWIEDVSLTKDHLWIGLNNWKSLCIDVVRIGVNEYELKVNIVDFAWMKKGDKDE